MSRDAVSGYGIGVVAQKIVLSRYAHIQRLKSKIGGLDLLQRAQWRRKDIIAALHLSHRK